MTMPAHPPNNDCPCRQSLLGVVATNLPGADLNSSAGPKGGGHDCRDAGGRAMQEQLPRMPAIKSCRAQPFAVSLRKLVRNAGNARTSHQPSRCVPDTSDRNAASRRSAARRSAARRSAARSIPAVVLRRRYAAPCMTLARSERSTWYDYACAPSQQ